MIKKAVLAALLLITIISVPAIFAEVAKGTPLHETNSDKVCGVELCSVAHMAKPEMPEGIIITPENDDPDAVYYFSDEPVELLFVQTANAGTFLQKDGRNILTLEVSPTTVWFSDRPHRITGFMQTDVFVAMWAEGTNSFAENPPNAALDILDGTEDADVFVIELHNPVYTPESETVQYDVILLEEATEGLTHYSKSTDAIIPSQFSHAALFIDDSELDSATTPLMIPGVSEFYGLDITTGISPENLVALSLFDFDNDDTIEVQIGDNNYLVPESLVIDVTDKYQMKSHVYSSIKELTDSLTASVGISYSSPAVDAEMDATYSQNSQTSESSYFATVDAFDRKYRLTAETGLEATDDFQNAVDALPSQYAGNQKEYFDFFSSFGTHFTDYVEYGGIMHYWSQESDTESMTAEEFSVSVSATVNEVVGGEVSATADVSTSSSESSSESDVNVSIKGSGGDSSYLGAYLTKRSSDSFDDWWASIDDNPGLMNIKYDEIYNLVTDHNKKTQLQNALSDYLRSDFGYQVLLTNKDNGFSTTILVGTNNFDTDDFTYPDSKSIEKGGLIVISDAVTGETVHQAEFHETDSSHSTISEFADVIKEYEKKGNSYLYFVGLFSDFDSSDQSKYTWFEKIGASAFTDLPIGKSNYYMLIGLSDTAEGYAQDKWLTAQIDSAGPDDFADTNCEFSGGITKTTDGFTAIGLPTISNCTVPSSQFVQSLEVFVSTKDHKHAGTSDKITLTLGGIDFVLPHDKKYLKKATDADFTIDTTGQDLKLSTITDITLSRQTGKDTWMFDEVKILADDVEILHKTNLDIRLEDDSRVWGPIKTTN